MTETENLKFYIHLLELEIRALRSVLSEWDGDKECYTQWHTAQTIQQLKNHLVPPGPMEVWISLPGKLYVHCYEY